MSLRCGQRIFQWGGSCCTPVKCIRFCQNLNLRRHRSFLRGLVTLRQSSRISHDSPALTGLLGCDSSLLCDAHFAAYSFSQTAKMLDFLPARWAASAGGVDVRATAYRQRRAAHAMANCFQSTPSHGSYSQGNVATQAKSHCSFLRSQKYATCTATSDGSNGSESPTNWSASKIVPPI